MRAVRIHLSQHNGATTIELRISGPGTTDTRAPGTWVFEELIPGHVIKEHAVADEDMAITVVRAIGSELLRELSCDHGGNPWCTRKTRGFLPAETTEVIAEV